MNRACGPFLRHFTEAGFVTEIRFEPTPALSLHSPSYMPCVESSWETALVIPECWSILEAQLMGPEGATVVPPHRTCYALKVLPDAVRVAKKAPWEMRQHERLTDRSDTEVCSL